jgi:ADP-ribosylglycohydrolase
MIGAIIGDIVGSRFEFNPHKSKDFELITEKSRFTDDTVLTIAIADSILNDLPVRDKLYEYAEKYPRAGYGPMFCEWVKNHDKNPYNSFGNGSAMRVSAVGFFAQSLDEALSLAEISSIPTHNHPEGIKGAKSVAAAIFMAKNGSTKAEIKEYIEKEFEYDLNRTCDDIRKYYSFDVTCQGSVPEAIICFLESTDYVDAIRLAVSLSGDADTQACIAGGIAQAYYKKIPKDLIEQVYKILPQEFIDIIEEFNKKFGIEY